MNIQSRIAAVQERIAAACTKAGRAAGDVQVVAVTKYVSLERCGEAIANGLTDIGENRWQDVKPKWEAFGPQATWHFIGHLQTNKVKDVVDKFAYIHSLDRLSLAKELQKKALELDIIVNAFIQVNISGEESKHGLAPNELFHFAEQLQACPNIRVAGLMTMAPLASEHAEEARPVFRGLREWRDRLNEHRIIPYEVRGLSMGMSNDFEVAVEEGATYVRLGSILVGRE